MSSIISKLKVSLGLDNSKFKAGLAESEKKTKGFGDTMKGVAAKIGVAFGVREVLRFGAEVTKLASQAEGVERAFGRIGGYNTFDALKTATKGTVSELELMRKTVMAQNLGVPVENLAKLFEFATARAADTGESVDYLVSSIVTGIGRKSPLILDNLGISAIALKEKMNGVGLGTASVGDVAKAVGAIAEEELNKIGKAATTNGQKIQALGATWENLKVKIGQAITTSKEFNLVSNIITGLTSKLDGTNKEQDRIVEGANRIFNAWKSSGKLTEESAAARIAALKEENKTLIKGSTSSGKVLKERRAGNLALIKLLKTVKEEEKAVVVEEIRNMATLSAKIDDLKIDQQTATGSRLSDINKEIAALNKEIDALKKLGLGIKMLPKQDAINLDASVTQSKMEPLEVPDMALPDTISAEGTYGASEAFKQYKASVDGASQSMISAQDAASAYGSILSNVGSIASASGDSQVASMVSVATATLSAVATMMPALFSASVGGAVEAGSALPFPANIAAIAAGVGAVVSAFSGIGGGSASSSSGTTSIDTTGYDTPTTSSTASSVSSSQNISVEVTGSISNKTIALSNKQGTKDLSR